jgi:hypothetical protein
MNEISGKDMSYLSSALLGIARGIEKVDGSLQQIWRRLETTNDRLDEIANSDASREVSDGEG